MLVLGRQAQPHSFYNAEGGLVFSLEAWGTGSPRNTHTGTSTHFRFVFRVLAGVAGCRSLKDKQRSQRKINEIKYVCGDLIFWAQNSEIKSQLMSNCISPPNFNQLLHLQSTDHTCNILSTIHATAILCMDIVLESRNHCIRIKYFCTQKHSADCQLSWDTGEDFERWCRPILSSFA